MSQSNSNIQEHYAYLEQCIAANKTGCTQKIVLEAFETLCRACTSDAQREKVRRRQVMYLIDAGRSEQALNLFKQGGLKWPLGHAYALYRVRNGQEAVNLMKKNTHHSLGIDEATYNLCLTQCKYYSPADMPNARDEYHSLVSKTPTNQNREKTLDILVNFIAANVECVSIEDYTVESGADYSEALVKLANVWLGNKWSENVDVVINLALAYLHEGEVSKAIEVIHPFFPQLTSRITAADGTPTPLSSEETTLCAIAAVAYYSLGEGVTGRKYNDLVIQGIIARQARPRKRPRESSNEASETAAEGTALTPQEKSKKKKQYIPSDLTEAVCLMNHVELMNLKSNYESILYDTAIQGRMMKQRCNLLQMAQIQYNMIVKELRSGNLQKAFDMSKIFLKGFNNSQYAYLIHLYALWKVRPLLKSTHAHLFHRHIEDTLLVFSELPNEIDTRHIRYRVILLIVEMQSRMGKGATQLFETLAHLPEKERYCHNVILAMIRLLSNATNLPTGEKGHSRRHLVHYLNEASKYWSSNSQDTASPAVIATLSKLGSIQLERKLYEEAAATFQKLVKLAPEPTSVAYLVSVLVHTDLQNAAQIMNTLPEPPIPSNYTCEEMEQLEIPRQSSIAGKRVVIHPTGSAGDATARPKKKTKQQEKRRQAILAKVAAVAAKTHFPQPDPERWTSIRDRPSLKGKGKKVLLKMAQDRREYSMKKYHEYLERKQASRV